MAEVPTLVDKMCLKATRRQGTIFMILLLNDVAYFVGIVKFNISISGNFYRSFIMRLFMLRNTI